MTIPTPPSKLTADHRCYASRFCLVNRTSTVQVGHKLDRRCPACGAYYEEEKEPPQKETAEERQARIDQWLNRMRNPQASPGI